MPMAYGTVVFVKTKFQLYEKPNVLTKFAFTGQI